MRCKKFIQFLKYNQPVIQRCRYFSNARIINGKYNRELIYFAEDELYSYRSILFHTSFTDSLIRVLLRIIMTALCATWYYNT